MTYHQVKMCSKCGQVLLLDEFRWLNTQKRYMSSCKKCENLYHRNRYQSSTPHYNAAVKRIANLVKKHGNEVISDALRLLEDTKNE